MESTELCSAYIITKAEILRTSPFFIKNFTKNCIKSEFQMRKPIVAQLQERTGICFLAIIEAKGYING